MYVDRFPFRVLCAAVASCLIFVASDFAAENPHAPSASDQPDITESDPRAAAAREAVLLSGTSSVIRSSG